MRNITAYIYWEAGLPASLKALDSLGVAVYNNGACCRAEVDAPDYGAGAILRTAAVALANAIRVRLEAAGLPAPTEISVHEDDDGEEIYYWFPRM